jgi:hypothetical protein
MKNFRAKVMGLMNPRGAAFAMAALCFVGWVTDFATDRAGAAFAPPIVAPDAPVPVSVPRGGDARREILFDPYAPLFAAKGPLRFLNAAGGAGGSVPDVNYGEGYAAVDGSVRSNTSVGVRGDGKRTDDDVRYIGRVSGAVPIAVLQDGDQRRIVSVGDTFNHVVVMKIDERQVVLSSGRVIQFSIVNDAVAAPVVPAGPISTQQAPSVQPTAPPADQSRFAPRFTIPPGAAVQAQPDVDAAPAPTRPPQLTPATINQLNSVFGGSK